VAAALTAMRASTVISELEQIELDLFLQALSVATATTSASTRRRR
jgi:hypothetical protein